jgi:hypothetical protein
LGWYAHRRSRLQDGVVDPTLERQRDGQVAIRLRVARIDLDDALQVAGRFGDLPLRPEQHGKVEVRLGVLRVQRNRAPILGSGLIRASGRPAARSRG